MKKILFVLFLVLSFSLVGCDFFSNNTNESNGDDISGEYKNVVLSNGIGRSVNVIENKYIETYAGAKPVFDSSILSDFRLVRTPLQTQTAVSFSSDSAEGFIEQQQLKVDGKLSASAGLKKIFTASVSQAFTYESSYTFTQNTREMFYTVQQNIVGDRVEIEGYRDASIFEDALNSGFITDIEKVKTGDLTASEFINLYGTHVIVSGYFGGKINCYFYLKT